MTGRALSPWRGLPSKGARRGAEVARRLDLACASWPFPPQSFPGGAAPGIPVRRSQGSRAVLARGRGDPPPRGGRVRVRRRHVRMGRAAAAGTAAGAGYFIFRIRHELRRGGDGRRRRRARRRASVLAAMPRWRVPVARPRGADVPAPRVYPPPPGAWPPCAASRRAGPPPRSLASAQTGRAAFAMARRAGRATAPFCRPLLVPGGGSGRGLPVEAPAPSRRPFRGRPGFSCGGGALWGPRPRGRACNIL